MAGTQWKAFKKKNSFTRIVNVLLKFKPKWVEVQKLSKGNLYLS